MPPNVPRRRFLTLTGGAALAGVTGLSATSAGAATQRTLDNPLMTIPNLQQWTAGSGAGFALPEFGNQRIIIRSADAEALRQAAENLKLDLQKLTRRAFLVEVQDNPAPSAGDFVLARADLGLPNDEGYQIKVGPSIELTGPRAGVFHGVQTIVQWLKQRATVPAGVARDWPKYPERGFLVAISARRYSMTWWKGQINEMAYLKLNMLWLYVGYEETSPLAHVKEIAEYAKKYNITVVPQVNMPGHMDRLLQRRPDLGLPKGWGGHLDLSKAEAYPFARSLFEPYLTEFDTPYWHLGADEYITELGQGQPFHVYYDLFPELHAEAKRRYGSHAQPVDIFTGFVNEMNLTVRASGKQLRIWNDGLLSSITAAPLDKTVIVEHWASWDHRKTVDQLLTDGYQVHNSNRELLYYDPEIRRPEPQPIYDTFHPGVFERETVDPNRAGLRGAKLHLWTLPATEAEEFQSDRLLEPFRALSQVLWGSQKPHATYAGFAGLITTIGRPPLFPAGRHTTSPPTGATTVWPGRIPKVVFYDDVTSAQMHEGGTEAGTPGRSAYDPATRTLTFTPAAPWSYGKRCEMNWTASTGTGQLVGGQFTFTVAQRPSVAYPRSIFHEEDGPGVEKWQDSNEVEVGVRFRVDRPGRVTGVKFYKIPGQDARHTGTLWSSDGAKLATVTFQNESSMGWQTAQFDSPVPIQANATYVASYHDPEGKYGHSLNFFPGRQVDNGVLHALADTNGVFRYGPTAFPTESAGHNYYADVIFQPDTYTLFDVGQAPVFGDTEGTTLELGVQFSASVAGQAHGVRFFKGTHNTGTHVGSLWTADGQRLTSATFTGESASGWQEVRFAEPVAIPAGTPFVVSYSSSGGFSATEQGLAQPRHNGALTTSGPGRYALSSGTFPTQTFQNRNYFVDVVYSER